MSAIVAGELPSPTAPSLAPADEPPGIVPLLTRAYARLLLAGFALLPAALIGYLYFCQDPARLFEDHAFHYIAIAAATLEGLFVTYVTWLCYRSSGEPVLRWMTLAFLGFSLTYGLHGAFTGHAHDNIWLFLLYGPASRLVMAILLLLGLLSYLRPPHAADRRMESRSWLIWIGSFLLVDVAVAYLANSSIAGFPALRSMEGAALVFCALNVTVLVARRIRSPLMVIFALAVTWFALSSLAFMLGRPWNHMWWLAHAIFAAGFFLLSYGVAHAFFTTRSFSAIYSQEEMMARLAGAMARTEDALQEVRRTNQKLEVLAATDPLTGADNRRRFGEHVEAELGRINRGGAPFSVLALDLDEFKPFNDRYGLQAGDDVLKALVHKCLAAVRPYDNVARMGNAEFMVLLPRTAAEAARLIAERIRTAVAGASFESGNQRLSAVTVSIGVAQSGRDGDTMDAILRAADARLRDAKQQGRNRVIAA